MVEQRIQLGPGAIGAEVLARLARLRQTGSLSWHGAGDNRTIVIDLHGGRPVAASKNGGQLIGEGSVVISAIRHLAIAIDGYAVFCTTSATVDEAMKVDVFGEMIVALVGGLKAQQVGHILKTRARHRLFPTNGFSKVAGAVSSMARCSIKQPAPNIPVAVLLDGATFDVQRAWIAIMALGGVRTDVTSPIDAVLPMRSGSSGAVPASSAPVRPQTHRAEPPTATGSQLQVSICSAFDAAKEQNHYEFIGVAKNADEATIRSAYFSLVKSWHSDRIKKEELPEETMEQASELFQRLEEAYGILSHTEQRKSYDYILDRRQRGLPTDPKIIMQAEGLFDKAQTLIRGGQAAAAEPLLQEAVTLNPGEGDFWVYFGYASYCAHGAEVLQTARDHIRKGIDMGSPIDVAKVFLGRIAAIEGSQKAALGYFEEALQTNRKNVDAQREIRLINMRKTQRNQQEAGLSGLLTKMFKR